tara:strand:- start:476 stop:628 length:153 start_codon:yes stop_codon:yes gene_type:complete
MEILLATLLSCSDAQGIIDKIPPSAEYRTEIIQTISGGAEPGCFEDANVD